MPQSVINVSLVLIEGRDILEVFQHEHRIVCLEKSLLPDILKFLQFFKFSFEVIVLLTLDQDFNRIVLSLQSLQFANLKANLI